VCGGGDHNTEWGEREIEFHTGCSLIVDRKNENLILVSSWLNCSQDGWDRIRQSCDTLIVYYILHF